MRRCIFSVVAVFLVLCLAPPGWAAGNGKVEFKVGDIGDSSNELARLASQEIVGGEVRPTALKGAPRPGSTPLAYMTISTGGGPLLVAMEYGAGVSKLYVDLDRSGDLSRREPLLSRNAGGKQVFPGFAIKGAGETKIYIKAEAVGPQTLLVYPAGMMSGSVALEGKTYRVFLADADLDGTYNKPYAAAAGRAVAGGALYVAPNYDVFAIDRNGNGRLDREVNGACEAMALPKMVKIADACYGLTVAADGKGIEAAKVDSPELGTLDVGSDCIDLAITSENGGYRICNGRAKCELPVGVYVATSFGLAKKDGQGVLWTIDGYASAVGLVTIKKGETTTLKLGTPLVAKVDMQSGSGGSVSFGVSIYGQNDERYAPGVYRNGVKQAPPRFKVVADGSGKELLSSAFAYG